MKAEGYPVDAIEPQGGIYLSVKIDLIGRKGNGKMLQTSSDVARYLLDQQGIAILPFSAFGAPSTLPWFRISVGTCKKTEITPMLNAFQNCLSPFKEISTVSNEEIIIS